MAASSLEGRHITRTPDEIIFRDYLDKWLLDMTPGMSESQIRDYTSTLNCHLLPYFGLALKLD